ncbi:MAG: pyridoxamine 5'-phosphate oxidase, partial [Roseibium sp.]|uniref:RT0821/Lpp0805 family surface protein n=1 Tax=Roseibium sp. TaxID=1936156 RepID=UPI00261BF94F
NASSGNSGTLTNIDTAALSDTGCISFQTTANTIAGIKLYSGTACRDITQKFAVTTLIVADA